MSDGVRPGVALSYCSETQRVDIDTEGGDVLLLELAR